MVYTSLTFGSTYWAFKKYFEVYQRSIKDPEGFWKEEARRLEWFKTWDKVIEWQPPYAYAKRKRGLYKRALEMLEKNKL